MDKILSARVDEDVLRRLGALARKLGKTKKSVIEEAIRMYASRVEAERGIDSFDRGFGVWKREEPVEDTVEQGKKAFRESIRRHHE